MLIQLIVVLLICGLLLWALESFPYIDSGIKQIIKIVIVVVVCLWLIDIVAGGLYISPLFHWRR